MEKCSILNSRHLRMIQIISQSYYHCEVTLRQSMQSSLPPLLHLMVPGASQEPVIGMKYRLSRGFAASSDVERASD